MMRLGDVALGFIGAGAARVFVALMTPISKRLRVSTRSGHGVGGASGPTPRRARASPRSINATVGLAGSVHRASLVHMASHGFEFRGAKGWHSSTAP